MKFTYGTTVVELVDPAQYPMTRVTKKIQAKERTASGILQVETYNVLTDQYTYVFKNIDDSDYTSLLNFFFDQVNGMVSVFDLTDDLGITRTVRFLDSELKFKNVALNCWEGKFTVEKAQS